MARRRRQRPQTLIELYSVAKADPSDLLASLSASQEWTVPDEHQDAALRLLGERDRDLGTTRNLALLVANSHGGRFGMTFGQFLIRAVEPDLRGTPGWPPAFGVVSSETLQRLLTRHGAALARKEPPRRLLNAVLIAQSVLVACYGLDVQTAAPLLAKALGPPALLKTGRPGSRGRVRALGYPFVPTEAMRIWLDLLCESIESSAEAKARAERLEARGERLETLSQGLAGC